MAGCGGEGDTTVNVVAPPSRTTVIDADKTEAAIKRNLEDTMSLVVADVACPTDIEVEAGATFECEVNLSNGRLEMAVLQIENSDADVSLTALR